MKPVARVVEVVRKAWQKRREQCCAELHERGIITYCVLRTGHSGPHQTYSGREFMKNEGR